MNRMIEWNLRFHNIVEIGDNLYIYKSFTDQFSTEIIYPLLKDVAEITLCGKSAQELPPCLIHPACGTNPKCSNTVEEPITRIISLTVNRTAPDLWIYQFAHEYCHHTINGGMLAPAKGQPIGLQWFEETLCELNSLYQLTVMAGRMVSHSSQTLQAYAIPVLYMVEGQKASCAQQQKLLQLGGGVSRFESLLSGSQGYQREFYTAIALKLLPFFQQNPYLWKILHHIGDIREYDSLTSLLVHLHMTADDSYRNSLGRMISCLLP